MLKTFSTTTTSLCFRLQELHRRTCKIGAEREGFEREQAAFQRELKDKEGEQAALAEAEEFERADALSSVVAHINQETALRATALQELALELDALDREKAEKRREKLRACAIPRARSRSSARSRSQGEKGGSRTTGSRPSGAGSRARTTTSGAPRGGRG